MQFALFFAREAVMATIFRLRSASLLLLAMGPMLLAGDPARYQVVIKDGASVARDLLLPIDPQIRIVALHSNNIYFGLTVDNVRITCSPQGSIWPAALIDGTLHNAGNGVIQLQLNGNMPLPIQGLPKGAGKKERHGFMAKWKMGPLDFTQMVEVVPAKPVDAAPGAKRRMDTCRVTYIAENKDTAPHDVAFRANIDILINNNDGALFASPTTEPGQVLNGVVLEGKKLPTFLQVLERPNVKDPGFAAVMTLKSGGKVEGPSKVVLTQLGALGAAWDVPALAAGDSACAIYWDKKVLKPGEKREMTWAYGGGIAADAEGEGKLSLALGGNLEPGRLFSISALVEDAALSQTLALELPPGIERIEGAEIQPVPAPTENGHSLVLWRGRVTRPGAFEIKVRSSTGVTQTKSISVVPIARR